MNIRKLAKWFGLRWSNKLENMIPKFERDLLIIVNRTINNSEVTFDEKVQTLEQMQKQFQNSKYYEGLLRVYGNFQLFDKMEACIKEIDNKKLPFNQQMKNIITEYALIKPVDPKNQIMAQSLIKTYSNITNESICFANEDGTKNVSLEAYLDNYKPQGILDFEELSGILSVDEKPELIIELIQHMNKKDLKVNKTIYDRGIRSCTEVKNHKMGIQFIKQALGKIKTIDQELIAKFMKTMPRSDIVSLVLTLKEHREFEPGLALRGVLTKYDENLNKTIEKEESQEGKTMAYKKKLKDLIKGATEEFDEIHKEMIENGIIGDGFILSYSIQNRLQNNMVKEAIDLFCNNDYKTIKDCNEIIISILKKVNRYGTVEQLARLNEFLKSNDYPISSEYYIFYLHALYLFKKFQLFAKVIEKDVIPQNKFKVDILWYSRFVRIITKHDRKRSKYNIRGLIKELSKFAEADKKQKQIPQSKKDKARIAEANKEKTNFK
ncbi:hypothetical protein K502DRAFT_333211 [Neoconidiobolus thromboides FSU 785]|nr:hypothetical protein K502DRAFT_333211 [Neoconidiobolus thromboides FSU 785]